MNLVKKKNNNVKIIPLGGVGEIAKNMYVIEIDDEMIMLDAGLMFPETEMLGIDVVIPNVQYVIDNKERLKGIFLTHGHDDAIGALPYIINHFDCPIYGSKLTIELVKKRFEEKEINKSLKYYYVHNNSIMRFKNMNITFFKTTHSIPDSLGICIHTSFGAIVYTGEFKFDQSLTGAYQSDIGKMASIGKQGVFCLLSDSTEAEKAGYNIPEFEVANVINEVFYKAKGRIISSCYASNFISIQQLIDAASQTNRKVAFLGKNLMSAVNVARELGYFEIPEGVIIDNIEDVVNYPDNEICIIATGKQGEPIEALKQMALNKHKYINVKKGDTVFVATTPSPNMEVILYKTYNLLVKAGAKLITTNKKLHASSHAQQEELKMMLNLMKPKYFIPIQGEYRHQIAHAKLAVDTGVNSEDIFILEKGDIVETTDKGFEVTGHVIADNVLIDGIGVGDVGNIVLRDRRILSEDGIFIVVVTLDTKKRRIAAGPQIQSRGFVYVRESEDLLKEAEQHVQEIIESALMQRRIEWAEMKQDIRDDLARLLYENTKRRPMIIPIITEI